MLHQELACWMLDVAILASNPERWTTLISNYYSEYMWPFVEETTWYWGNVLCFSSTKVSYHRRMDILTNIGFMCLFAFAAGLEVSRHSVAAWAFVTLMPSSSSIIRHGEWCWAEQSGWQCLVGHGYLCAFSANLWSFSSQWDDWSQVKIEIGTLYACYIFIQYTFIYTISFHVHIYIYVCVWMCSFFLCMCVFNKRSTRPRSRGTTHRSYWRAGGLAMGECVNASIDLEQRRGSPHWKAVFLCAFSGRSTKPSKFKVQYSSPH